MKEFCAYLKNKLINSTYENSKTLINLDEEYEKYSKMKNELTNNIPSDKSKKKIKEFCEYLKRKLLNSNNQTAINIKFSMENKMWLQLEELVLISQIYFNVKFMTQSNLQTSSIKY